MSELLTAIEGLPAVSALKTSFVAYPIVNALHILSIGALVTTVLLMDFRLLGAFAFVPAVPLLRLLKRVAIIAFAGAALTGSAMFTVKARDYGASPVFLLKMTLIGAAIVNFLLFRWLEISGRDTDRPPPLLLRASAALSAMLWLGTLFAGRFIGFL